MHRRHDPRDTHLNLMTTPVPLRRRYFYFSLRTLFVVVTILGAFLGWLGVQVRWIHDRRQALEWILPYHARQLAAESGSLPPPLKGSVSHAGMTAPWSLRILGEKGIERLEVDQDWLGANTPYSLAKLRLLFPEAKVLVVVSRHAHTASEDKDRIVVGEEWIVPEEAVN